ncbi:MAG: VWA domain-containing protein [Spirochaetes bacterium]|nr:VWA domain-containing protein [Spirochaetota bacterium]MBU0954993.1 VWA domain-containing protein [Spirochaetota bacterium]
MNGLRYPFFLLLWLLPLFYLLLQRHRLSGRKAAHIRRVQGLPLPLDVWQGSTMPGAGFIQHLLLQASHLFLLLAWLLLCLVLAAPYRSIPSAAAGSPRTDVMIVMDVSPSMAALDLSPNRMTAAVRIVEAFLKTDAPASIGLLAFGAESALICPPTTDHQTVRERLDMLKPGLLGNGTALGIALSQAYSLLVSADGRRKVLVLVSDGEDNVGRVYPGDIALQCLRNQVYLLVIGAGTKGTVDMDYIDPYSGEQRRGSYESDFNEPALQELARTANGRYLGPAQADHLVQLSLWLEQVDPDAALSGSAEGLGNPEAREYFTRQLWLLCCLFIVAGWFIRTVLLGGVL